MLVYLYIIIYLFIYWLIDWLIEVVMLYFEILGWHLSGWTEIVSGYFQNTYQKHYLLSSIPIGVNDIAWKLLHLEVKVLKH